MTDVVQAEAPSSEESGVKRTVEEERSYRKQQLAAAFRIFARLGYDEGTSGHITVRDPGDPKHFWVNPYTVHFSRIRVSDLLLIDEKGHVIEGTRKPNQSAFSIHSAIHDARPDVDAVAHSHSIYGRAWASLGRVLDPIVQESCAFFQDHSVFTNYGGLVLDRGAGDLIAEELGDKRAVFLQHHGHLTVGKSVEEACWWFINMDRCCRIQLLAEAAGDPIHIDDENAALARRQFGSANRARNNFKLLADIVFEEEPDVLT